MAASAQLAGAAAATPAVHLEAGSPPAAAGSARRCCGAVACEMALLAALQQTAGSSTTISQQPTQEGWPARPSWLHHTAGTRTQRGGSSQYRAACCPILAASRQPAMGGANACTALRPTQLPPKASSTAQSTHFEARAGPPPLRRRHRPLVPLPAALAVAAIPWLLFPVQAALALGPLLPPWAALTRSLLPPRAAVTWLTVWRPPPAGRPKRFCNKLLAVVYPLSDLDRQPTETHHAGS